MGGRATPGPCSGASCTHALDSPVPELEARRNRFTALVMEVSKATVSYTERLHRAGLGPP